MDRFDAIEMASYGWVLYDKYTHTIVKDQLTEDDSKGLAFAWNEAFGYLKDN